MNAKQLPLFENERRCRGGSCAEVLPDGRHRCLHCGRIFKYYREGYTNCGITEKAFWNAVAKLRELGKEMPEDGVVID